MIFDLHLFRIDYHLMIKIIPENTSRNGASPIEIAHKTKEMENFREMYKKPLFVILITYSEVLHVGLIVAFVSPLILKRKRKTDTITTINN